MRQEIWVKLLGKASFNPVSALTRATLIEMVRDPGISVLIRHIRQQVELVSRKKWEWSSLSRSIKEWPAPKKSARKEPPCCRISLLGGPWSSERSSPRLWNWQSG
jgi:hypothetical protein